MSFMSRNRSRIFADGKISGIYGERGLGHYRLNLSVVLSMPRLQNVASASLLDLSGNLSVGIGGGSLRLGYLHPADSQRYVADASTDDSRTHQRTLAVELDHRRLEAVENVRLGGGLTLSAFLCAQVLYDGNFEMMTDTLTYTVPQSEWVEALRSMDYAERMLLEVPVPQGERDSRLIEPVKHLGEAHQAMLRGKWRETVGCCRDVLESLQTAVGDRDAKDDTLDNLLFENTRTMDKDARLRLVRRALLTYCHPARHTDPNAAAIEWGREDAVAAVAIISTLIRQYAAE